MKRKTIFSLVVATLSFSACDNSTPPGGPGILTAVLVSPNGVEGAAVLDVAGTVESISAANDVSLFTTPSATGTRVILVRLVAGELSVKLAVADVSRPPAVSVAEVSDESDNLRQSLAGYRVEFR